MKLRDSTFSRTLGCIVAVLLPLVEFKVDKKSNELNFNLFQNPWKLVNVQDRTKK